MGLPQAHLTESFLEKVAATGLTDAAAARAIGVTRQYYSQVKLGKTSPSVAFIVGAIHAGLATSFNDVAEPAKVQSAA